MLPGSAATGGAEEERQNRIDGMGHGQQEQLEQPRDEQPRAGEQPDEAAQAQEDEPGAEEADGEAAAAAAAAPAEKAGDEAGAKNGGDEMADVKLDGEEGVEMMPVAEEAPQDSPKTSKDKSARSVPYCDVQLAQREQVAVGITGSLTLPRGIGMNLNVTSVAEAHEELNFLLYARVAQFLLGIIVLACSASIGSGWGTAYGVLAWLFAAVNGALLLVMLGSNNSPAITRITLKSALFGDIFLAFTGMSATTELGLISRLAGGFSGAAKAGTVFGLLITLFFIYSMVLAILLFKDRQVLLDHANENVGLPPTSPTSPSRPADRPMPTVTNV